MNITKENISFEFNNTVKGIPTLILVGEREKIYVKKSAQRTMKYIKNSRYYIVKEAGHGIPYEKPVLFNDILISFILQNNIVNVQGVIS